MLPRFRRLRRLVATPAALALTVALVLTSATAASAQPDGSPETQHCGSATSYFDPHYFDPHHFDPHHFDPHYFDPHGLV